MYHPPRKIDALSFQNQGPAFMLMENIQAFIGAAKNYGVPDEEMFLTPDLFEGRNLPQVRLDLMFVPRIILSASLLLSFCKLCIKISSF